MIDVTIMIFHLVKLSPSFAIIFQYSGNIHSVSFLNLYFVQLIFLKNLVEFAFLKKLGQTLAKICHYFPLYSKTIHDLYFFQPIFFTLKALNGTIVRYARTMISNFLPLDVLLISFVKNIGFSMDMLNNF